MIFNFTWSHYQGRSLGSKVWSYITLNSALDSVSKSYQQIFKICKIWCNSYYKLLPLTKKKRSKLERYANKIVENNNFFSLLLSNIVSIRRGKIRCMKCCLIVSYWLTSCRNSWKIIFAEALKIFVHLSLLFTIVLRKKSYHLFRHFKTKSFD